MSTETKNLFKNLLYLLFEVSRQIPLGQVDSTLERGIDEINHQN
jgi:hypothetical protein